MQIKQVKGELAMQDTLTGRGQVTYNHFTDAEAAEYGIKMCTDTG